MFVLLVGCQSNQHHEDQLLPTQEVNEILQLQFSVELSSVTPTGLKYLVENCDNPGTIWSYGSSFHLEYLGNDGWTVVDYLSVSPLWAQVLISVSSGNTSSQEVDWTQIYGELSSGTYRIVKDFTRTEGETAKKYTLFADFKIL